MIADDLSRFEFCPRLPSLYSAFEPRQWPIREAVRRYFERGVRMFYGGIAEPWTTIPMEFLEEAAQRGFDYPEGEPYYLAKDHADWLEGVLRLLPVLDLEPLPVDSLDGEHLEINGYCRDGEAHLFRVLDSFDEKVRWPELLVFGKYPAVVVHQFRLPRVSGGRLCSPACMAYSHPITKQLRLAKLEGEPQRFGPSWKRQARWELGDIDWQEWLEGIRRDKALDLIYRAHRVDVEISEDDLADIRRDAAMMFSYMRRPQPRQRETCGSCMFWNFCHGGERGRHDYVGADQSVLDLRASERDHLVPQGSQVG